MKSNLFNLQLEKTDWNRPTSKAAQHVDFWLKQGSLNHDSTNTNEYLFSQFVTTCFIFILLTIKQRRKNGQAFLVLICTCVVLVHWSLVKV
jgi:hypothetical protein